MFDDAVQILPGKHSELFLVFRRAKSCLQIRIPADGPHGSICGRNQGLGSVRARSRIFSIIMHASSPFCYLAKITSCSAPSSSQQRSKCRERENSKNSIKA